MWGHSVDGKICRKKQTAVLCKKNSGKDYGKLFSCHCSMWHIVVLWQAGKRMENIDLFDGGWQCIIASERSWFAKQKGGSCRFWTVFARGVSGKCDQWWNHIKLYIKKSYGLWDKKCETYVRALYEGGNAKCTDADRKRTGSFRALWLWQVKWRAAVGVWRFTYGVETRSVRG